MGAYGGPDIITDGLVLALDAGSERSYPGTGTAWKDLSGNGYDFTFGAALSWNSIGTFSMTQVSGGGAVFSGNITSSTTCTMQFWIKTTDGQSLLWEPTTSPSSYVGAYKSSSKFYNGSGVGSPQYYQDLVLYNNIYDNLIDGEWHMVEFKAVNLSTFGYHGFNTYTNYQFGNGEIASIMIYDRNLTAAESQQNYNAQKKQIYIMYTGPDIITDGLVFAVDAGSERSYPGSGTTTTDLISSITGTLTNGTSFNSGNGGAFVFDGTDDYITFGNAQSLKNQDEGTISIWVHPETTSMKFALGWHGNTANYMRLEVSGNGTVKWVTEVGNVGNVLTSTATTPIDEWTNIILTQNGTNSKFYINGVLQSGSGNDTWFATHPTLTLYLGSELSWGGYDFDGKISNTLIYSRVLTAAEVLQNYNAQKSRFL